MHSITIFHLLATVVDIIDLPSTRDPPVVTDTSKLKGSGHFKISNTHVGLYMEKRKVKKTPIVFYVK